MAITRVSRSPSNLIGIYIVMTIIFHGHISTLVKKPSEHSPLQGHIFKVHSITNIFDNNMQ